MPLPTLEEISRRAAVHFALNNDDKMFVSEEEMKVLLAAPTSECYAINIPQDGGGYVTELIFSKMHFITATDQPINFGSIID